jgi:hypothetical protein
MDAGGPPDGWQGRSEPSSRSYVSELQSSFVISASRGLSPAVGCTHGYSVVEA